MGVINTATKTCTRGGGALELGQHLTQLGGPDTDPHFSTFFGRVVLGLGCQIPPLFSIVLPFSSLQKIWIRCQVSRQRNICGLVIPQAVHSWGSKMGPSRQQSSFNTNSMIWWYPPVWETPWVVGDCFLVILQSDFHPITLEEKWMKCQKLALQIPSVKSRNAIYSLYLISMYAISTSNRSLFDLLSPTYGCSNLFFAGGKSGCKVIRQSSLLGKGFWLGVHGYMQFLLCFICCLTCRLRKAEVLTSFPCGNDLRSTLFRKNVPQSVLSHVHYIWPLFGPTDPLEVSNFRRSVSSHKNGWFNENSPVSG